MKAPRRRGLFQGQVVGGSGRGGAPDARGLLEDPGGPVGDPRAPSEAVPGLSPGDLDSEAPRLRLKPSFDDEARGVAIRWARRSSAGGGGVRWRCRRRRRNDDPVPSPADKATTRGPRENVTVIVRDDGCPSSVPGGARSRRATPRPSTWCWRVPARTTRASCRRGSGRPDQTRQRERTSIIVCHRIVCQNFLGHCGAALEARRRRAGRVARPPLLQTALAGWR